MTIIEMGMANAPIRTKNEITKKIKKYANNKEKKINL